MKTCSQAILFATLILSTITSASAQLPAAAEAPPTISPEELVKVLKESGGTKAVILNVGPKLLYEQAHIPGSEFIGAGADSRGIDALRSRVQRLTHDSFIVLYCGCCPWSHCPNVRPAYAALHSAGFSNVKVLYIANNFGADWVDRGYPTVRGQ